MNSIPLCDNEGKDISDEMNFIKESTESGKRRVQKNIDFVS